MGRIGRSASPARFPRTLAHRPAAHQPRRRAARVPAHPARPPGWHLRNGSLVAGEPTITDAAPGIVPESLHPWVWDAARKLWESGHRRHAVQAAATAINKHLQDKLDRHDLADDKLLQEAFSVKAAEPGKPRLRIPGDPSSPTVASLQRGVPQFGVGCFWVIRNPTTHETAEWSPQKALEQLAALSILARLIDMCDVATHSAANPEG
jgi:hypothetical protein